MAATVVALGDSVTVGVGDIGVPAGWAAHLSFALGAAEFTNVARLGARARDVSGIQAAGTSAHKTLRPMSIRPWLAFDAWGQTSPWCSCTIPA